MKFADKVLCVGLKTSAIGSSIQDLEASFKVQDDYNAAEGSLTVNKARLKEPTKKIRKLYGELRRHYRTVTLPGISEDLRITTPNRLTEFQTTVDAYKERLEKLVREIQDDYPNIIAKEKADLGDRFRQTDYPIAEELPAHFQIILKVTDMPNGDYARIQGLADKTIQEMSDNHQKMLTEVGSIARNEVFKRLAELIQHIADKMSNPDAKSFHESTFQNLRDYLALVPDLNITNDPILENIRSAALERLDYSMKQVKDSEILKEQAAEAAKDILARFGAVGANRKLLSA